MRLICATLAAIVVAASPALSQGPAAIDPVAVSPDMYNVLLENDYVRVVEYTIKPGERDRPHTHPPKVSYVLNGGSLRIAPDGAEAFVSDDADGEVTFRGAVGRHTAENVGKTPVRIILFEVKRVDRPAAPHAEDPPVVNPMSVKVKLENDSVRVLEAVLPPGFKEKQHTHPPYATYVIDGGSVRMHLADGTTHDAELTPGQAIFSNPVTHWAENTGSSTLRLILVEVRHR
jgi:Cupin domain.